VVGAPVVVVVGVFLVSLVFVQPVVPKLSTMAEQTQMNNPSSFFIR
jgi:hypothetical protein